MPFPIADGTCWFCTHGLPTQCEASNPNYGPQGGLLRQKGGGLFGYTDLYGGHEGGQAEKVRVPFADHGCRKVPDGLRDEEVLLLTDVFPTGWTALDRADLRSGETVAVFGCGPVGIMAMKAAKLMGAGRVVGVDVQEYRARAAERLAGAVPLVEGEDDVVERIREMTEGRGADVVVDAVGMEAERNLLEKVGALVHLQRGTMKALSKCFDAVRRGGRVSVVGVYGTPFDDFPLHQVFDKELKIFTGQALVHEHVDRLLDLVKDRKVRLDDVITHTLPLDEAPYGYSVFNRNEDGCLKVVLKP